VTKISAEVFDKNLFLAKVRDNLDGELARCLNRLVNPPQPKPRWAVTQIRLGLPNTNRPNKHKLDVREYFCGIE
jgi:hypothetical protein